MSLHELSACEAADAIRRREIRSQDLVGACLARIASIEDRVQAWTYLDPAYALEQARAADRRQDAGEPLGPLHGVPVGVKDIFDTADMPTENGTVLHAGRRPSEDATAVALLRRAGAVVLGKTVTAELAVYAPGKTTNPHDPGRTPGGSSSGSAAAVASFMVPLAIGTQTNGSLIRPASYCGTCGFKPSHGSIPRTGVLAQSRLLDHPGVFARTVDDVASISRVLFAHDPRDPDTRPDARLEIPASPGAPLRVAFVRSPPWPDADDDAKAAFVALARRWDDVVTEVELPKPFESAIGWHRAIMESDLARSYADLYARGRERLSPMLVQMIERGRTVAEADYRRAEQGAAGLARELVRLFERFDAILTPATQGEAPLGLASTGSPMFCTAWTLCGVPAISLPILAGAHRMPIGVQVVGPKGGDGRLLAIARELEARARAEAPGRGTP